MLVARDGHEDTDTETTTATTTTTTTTKPECLVQRSDIKKATASSVLKNAVKTYGPNFAIDGNVHQRENKYFFNSQERPRETQKPWFQLEFKRPMLVVRVEITNRDTERLYILKRFRDIMVRVGNFDFATAGNRHKNAECGIFKGPATVSGGVEKIKCAKPLTGKYLAVQRLKPGILHINEIEVFSQC